MGMAMDIIQMEMGAMDYRLVHISLKGLPNEVVGCDESDQRSKIRSL